MTLYEKYFKNKTKEEKKKLQQWIFRKAQTFLFHTKPLSERTHLPLNNDKWK